MILASTEVAIVVSKFATYLEAPDWSFWRLLWFTNKLYVLAFFILLLVLLSRRAARAALRRSDGGRT